MAAETISKRCNTCKEVKPLSEFHKRLVSRDGFQNICKMCILKYNKKYFQTEKGKAVQNCYQQSEKFKAAYKRYEHSEKGKITKSSYRQSEKGKININHCTKLRKIRYPQKIKAKDAIHIAIKAGKLISPKFLLCHYCPKPAQQYHHWQGYAPEHWLDVVPACIKCHNEISKNSKQVSSLTT